MKLFEINKTPALVQAMLDGRLEGRTVDWITFTDYEPYVTNYASGKSVSYWFKGNINISPDIVGRVGGRVDFIYASDRKPQFNLFHSVLTIFDRETKTYVRYSDPARTLAADISDGDVGNLIHTFVAEIKAALLQNKIDILDYYHAECARQAMWANQQSN